jgi:translation initiation factor 1
MSDRKLVYSTDPRDQKKIDEDSKNKPKSPPNGAKGSVSFGVDLGQLEVIFKLEKSGRGGKTVTILERLPRHEEWLKTFAKDLKAKCGTGGTHLIRDGFGVIEIQGDKRDQLKKILDAKGIRYRGM